MHRPDLVAVFEIDSFCHHVRRYAQSFLWPRTFRVRFQRRVDSGSLKQNCTSNKQGEECASCLSQRLPGNRSRGLGSAEMSSCLKKPVAGERSADRQADRKDQLSGGRSNSCDPANGQEGRSSPSDAQAECRRGGPNGVHLMPTAVATILGALVLLRPPPPKNYLIAVAANIPTVPSKGRYSFSHVMFSSCQVARCALLRTRPTATQR